MIAAAVEGDAPEPRAERAGFAVGGEGVPCADEGFLTDIFGVLVVAETAEAEAVEGWAVAIDEALECEGVAAGGGGGVEGVPCGLFWRGGREAGGVKEPGGDCHGSIG